MIHKHQFEDFAEIEKSFDILKNRIIEHRKKCKGWNKAEPCFDCHFDTLTKIEKAIHNL